MYMYAIAGEIQQRRTRLSMGDRRAIRRYLMARFLQGPEAAEKHLNAVPKDIHTSVRQMERVMDNDIQEEAGSRSTIYTREASIRKTTVFLSALTTAGMVFMSANSVHNLIFGGVYTLATTVFIAKLSGPFKPSNILVELHVLYALAMLQDIIRQTDP